MLLNIIIPVYNEERTLDEVLSLVESQRLPCEKEILVVDDGSVDGSRDIALKHTSTVRLLIHEVNQGKGGAIRTGLRHTKGDFICIQDADMEYLPADLPRLVTALQSEHHVAIFGTRFSRIPAGRKITATEILNEGSGCLHLSNGLIFQARDRRYSGSRFDPRH